jgi:hypothetical protein
MQQRSSPDLGAANHQDVPAVSVGHRKTLLLRQPGSSPITHAQLLSEKGKLSRSWTEFVRYRLKGLITTSYRLLTEDNLLKSLACHVQRA